VPRRSPQGRAHGCCGTARPAPGLATGAARDRARGRMGDGETDDARRTLPHRGPPRGVHAGDAARRRRAAAAREYRRARVVAAANGRAGTAVALHRGTRAPGARRGRGGAPRPPANTGERAWWLQQTIAQVPPSHWTAAHGLDARTVLALARKTDVDTALLNGFVTATARYGDDAWRIAFIEMSNEMPDLMPYTVEANAGANASPARVAVIARALETRQPRAGELAATVPGPWDVAVSRAFAGFMKAELATTAGAARWWG